MKKFLIVIVLILVLAFAVGCDDERPEVKTKSESRWIEVLYDEDEYGDTHKRYILVDKLTNVCYLVVRQRDGGGVTVMLDSDGKPLLYEKEKEQCK